MVKDESKIALSGSVVMSDDSSYAVTGTAVIVVSSGTALIIFLQYFIQPLVSFINTDVALPAPACLGTTSAV